MTNKYTMKIKLKMCHTWNRAKNIQIRFLYSISIMPVCGHIPTRFSLHEF